MARFGAQGISIDLPFTDLDKPFTVKLARRDDGTVLYTRRYAFPRSALFDTLSATGSFQSDTVWKFQSNARPRSPEFNRREINEDFRGEGTITATRGRWTARMTGEFTGTDQGDKRLRPPDGAKVDINRGQGMIEYKDGSTLIQGVIGDVNVDGNLDMVSQGYASRGFAVRSSFFDDRLKISGGNTFGADIRGTNRGVEAFDSANRRSAANLSVELLRSEVANISVLAGLVDTSRPAAANFRIGDVQDGEKNMVGGLGARLGLFNDRIRLENQFARSRYSNPSELNTVNEFGNSVDIGTTRGNVCQHRLDVDLYRGEVLNIRGHGQYSLVDALFRSVQSGATADRQTWDYGVSATYDFVSLAVGRNIFDNNVDDIPNILKTRQRTNSASIEFALDAFRGDTPQQPPDAGAPAAGPAEQGRFPSFMRRLIPNSIQLTHTTGAVEALNADIVIANSSTNGSEIPNQETESNGITLNWNWPIGSTSVTFSESTLDNRQPGRDTADTDDRSVSIDQNVTLGPVTASLRLLAGGFKNKDSATRSERTRYEGGVSLQVQLEKLPNLSMGFDASYEKERFLVDANSSLTNSWRANMALDFAKFIPKFDDRVQPYMTMNFTIDDTDRRDPNQAAQSVSNFTATLAVGFKL